MNSKMESSSNNTGVQNTEIFQCCMHLIEYCEISWPSVTIHIDKKNLGSKKNYIIMLEEE